MGIAAILALLIATLSGKRIIGLLYRLQVGETVRDLGLEGQKEFIETPFVKIKNGKANFNDTATTEIYTLSLHDALPI